MAMRPSSLFCKLGPMTKWAPLCLVMGALVAYWMVPSRKKSDPVARLRDGGAL